MFAAYLTNVPVDMTEPDGSILNCFASGDEYYSRLHDADGYTIIQSAENGFYYYAQKNNQEIVPSIYRANESHDLNQYGINPNIVISKSAYQNIRERWWNGIERRDAPTIGTVNNLNVFIRFSDEEEFGNSRTYYDASFNNENGPSMKHYFNEIADFQILAIYEGQRIIGFDRNNILSKNSEELKNMFISSGVSFKPKTEKGLAYDESGFSIHI